MCCVDQLSPPLFFAIPATVANDDFVPTAAVGHGLSTERLDSPATGPGSVSIVSVAAGQEIRKLPSSEIARSMSGNHPTAVTAGSNLHWPLRQSSVNWPSGSFRSTAVVRMTEPKGWRPAAIGW